MPRDRPLARLGRRDRRARWACFMGAYGPPKSSWGGRRSTAFGKDGTSSRRYSLPAPMHPPHKKRSSAISNERARMKFAAIADVHGNCPALEAVLADMAALGVIEVVNLGDHVSGPLEAARTADLLIERGFPSVRGDQDRRLLELHQAGTSTRGDIQQLERKHFDWMASMPPTLVYRDEVFLCHATPTDDAAFWLDYVA